ncbi:hypothetical protein [Amycolatopsis regifaucium]|uniref:Phosphoesterase PA-phosphatase n=1 Tax=Amycolatopsis regifaucium TaxID=546365 RepID=A0A154MW49_9PSEU|nr:hypothetical protein [Amycolatopsis regifaucium]KZB88588.1 hypothetical protein AVL48_00460 [Amycolatopsis regifaucium]OKA07241.1 hypothetical protein ATP06_0215330 [Amycolatopsis regifaucium]SFI52483.1 hypothetical protein SAMN04489731_11190 [Amycolatopsis regifaucium]
MSSPAETTSASTRQRSARVATEVLAPWVWVLLLPLAVAWRVTSHHVGETLLWGLITGVFGSILPMAVIVRGARKGRWDSHHVTDRAGRVIPFAACIGFLAVGFTILLVGDAPRELVALAAAELVSLIVAVAITFGLKFKVSMHAAVAAGAVAILVQVYDPWFAFLLIGVGWVCWSRVELEDHTTAEVSVGTLVGLMVGGGAYAALVPALM